MADGTCVFGHCPITGHEHKAFRHRLADKHAVKGVVVDGRQSDSRDAVLAGHRERLVIGIEQA